MLDKLVRDIAKGIGEAVVAPVTAANAVVKAGVREIKKATEGK